MRTTGTNATSCQYSPLFMISDVQYDLSKRSTSGRQDVNARLPIQIRDRSVNTAFLLLKRVVSWLSPSELYITCTARLYVVKGYLGFSCK